MEEGVQPNFGMIFPLLAVEINSWQLSAVRTAQTAKTIAKDDTKVQNLKSLDARLRAVYQNNWYAISEARKVENISASKLDLLSKFISASEHDLLLSKFVIFTTKMAASKKEAASGKIKVQNSIDWFRFVLMISTHRTPARLLQTCYFPQAWSGIPNPRISPPVQFFLSRPDLLVRNHFVAGRAEWWKFRLVK